MEKIIQYLGSLSFKGTQATVKKMFMEYVEYKCAKCRVSEYDNEAIPLQMDHINGDRTDNRLCNLRLLCPTCHSRTDTYAGKNKKRYQ